jgi:hypothetical protein
VSEIREFARPRRRCIFCDAPFTDRMEAWMGQPAPCACCEGALPGHWPIKIEKPPVQSQDLACDACGKVLYLAPASPVPKA